MANVASTPTQSPPRELLRSIFVFIILEMTESNLLIPRNLNKRHRRSPSSRPWGDTSEEGLCVLYGLLPLPLISSRALGSPPRTPRARRGRENPRLRQSRL